MQRELDQDLSPQEMALLHAHIRQCPDCAEWRTRLQKLANELEALPLVMPPYSIVDSILPKLPDRQERASAFPTFPEAGTDQDRTEGGQEVSSPRRRRPLYWSAAGGAAACLALGIFLFQNYGGMRQDAASMHDIALNTIPQSGSSKSAGGAPSGNGASPASSAKQETPSPEGTVRALMPSSQNQSAAPTRDSQQQDKKSDSPASGSPEASEKSRQPSPDAKLGGGASSTPSDTGTTSAKEPETAASPSSSKRPGKLLADAGLSAPSPSGGATPGDARTTGGNEIYSITGEQASPSPMDNNMEIAGGEAGRIPEGIVWLPGIAASSGQGLTGEPVKDKTGALSPSTRPPLSVSPEGTRTASAEQQRIVIRDDKGVILFASTHQWADSDRLSFAGWKQEDGFTYEVSRQDGSKQSYYIDLHLKTELPK